MVQMSDGFMKLAQANGRHVYCRIEVDGEVFYDDRIIEFDFDDVVHPDWFTLGTTCANRFYFSVKYSGEIAVQAVVKPYISFDNSEWCPLGIFYAARRYVRGEYASITCYDKMYSLDMAYESALSLPTDTTLILGEICEQTGLECQDKGEALTVETLPESCTVRDMIGYIAAMNRACAKIDRYGALVMKKPDRVDFALLENNCTYIRKNMSQSVITCVTADTGDEVLTAGEGAELSTVELYNPIISQKRLNVIQRQLAPFSFYGAEIEMQGMPFLEAGEMIELLYNKLLYRLIVSEIEYHYDGGLTATLYSKNKAYTDAVVHEDDLENTISELKSQIGAMYYKYSNEKQIAIKSDPAIVADFEFECGSSAFAQVDVNFTLSESTADFVMISTYVNGTRAARTAVHAPDSANGKELLHYYHLADNLKKGKNRIYVTMQTKTGDAYILPSLLFATVVGHGIKGSNSGSGGSDKVSLIEVFNGVPLGGVSFGLSKINGGFSASSEKYNIIPVSAENIADYFEVTNGEDYFFEDDGGTWTSNNGGVASSTATTTLTALTDVCGIIYYTYSSEAKYDKFTMTVGDETALNGVSGVSSGTKHFTLSEGQTITFEYAKDGSTDKNDDKCTFKITIEERI